MGLNPDIFVSSVSKEFLTLRATIVRALRDLNYGVDFQDDFGTEHGHIRETLRRKIDPCPTVIQIVGDGYGAEPPEPDEIFGRISYTQYEFYYAVFKAKNIIILDALGDCPRDREASELDLPPSPSSPQEARDYQDERQGLQRAYRNYLRTEYEKQVIPVRGAAHLEVLVRILHKTLTEFRGSSESWESEFKNRLSFLGTKLEAAVENQKLEAAQLRSAIADFSVRHQSLKSKISSSIHELRALLKDYFDRSTHGTTQLLLQIVLAEGAFAFRKDGPPTPMESIYDPPFARLLESHNGFEVEKSPGQSLVLFSRSDDALAFSLAYHRLLRHITSTLHVRMTAKLAITVGSVILRPATPGQDSALQFLDMDPTARRVVGLLAQGALPNQTLFTSGAYSLARGTAADRFPEKIYWQAHGGYQPGDGPSEGVYEVGTKGNSPFVPPPTSAYIRRILTHEEEELLGWRPMAGESVPYRTGWTLHEHLGSGPFGESWSAIDGQNQPRAVFKFCFDPNHLRSVRREVQVLRVLKEASRSTGYFASIVDWNLDHAPYFIEQKYYEAGNLEKYVSSRGGLSSMPRHERLAIAAEIAAAISAAHSQGIVHGCLKPTNILIDGTPASRPRILLSDFSIATLAEFQVAQAHGVTIGTLTFASSHGDLRPERYMAPELMRNQPPTKATDTYAFGVLLFQIMAGDFSLALGQRWEDLVPDEDLHGLIEQCIQEFPGKRPASLLSVQAQLQQAIKNTAQLQKNRLRKGYSVAKKGKSIRRGGRSLSEFVMDMFFAIPWVPILIVCGLAILLTVGYLALPYNSQESRFQVFVKTWSFLF